MQSQPIFETERLILSPRRPDETEDCLAMDRAPGVLDHVEGPWDDPVRHRAFIEARTRGPHPPGLGYWTIRLRAEPHRFAGWVLLIPEDAIGPAIEIGWRLPPDVWGRGYATEAARPLLAHAFRALGLALIVASIMPANAASLAVAAKLGFPPEGDAIPGSPYRRYVLRADGLTAGRARSGSAPATPERAGER